MMTVKETVEKYKGKSQGEIPSVYWFDGIDFLSYILAYKGNTINPNQYPRDYDIRMKQALINALDTFDTSYLDDFAAFDNSYSKKKKVRQVRDIEGELNIDYLLAGDSEKCFDNYIKILEDSKGAISVFINMAVAWCDKEKKDIQNALKEVYPIAATAEANGQPFRVVGVFPKTFSNYYNCEKVVTTFVVLKDYMDPIFPAMWAGLQSNEVCWALSCSYTWEIWGTLDSAGGYMSGNDIDLSKHVADDEEVLCFGQYLLASKNSQANYNKD